MPAANCLLHGKIKPLWRRDVIIAAFQRFSACIVRRAKIELLLGARAEKSKMGNRLLIGVFLLPWNCRSRDKAENNGCEVVPHSEEQAEQTY